MVRGGGEGGGGSSSTLTLYMNMLCFSSKSNINL